MLLLEFEQEAFTQQKGLATSFWGNWEGTESWDASLINWVIHFEFIVEWVTKDGTWLEDER